MQFQEAVDLLYQQLPMYQRQGAVALKPNLDNTILLLETLGNPHHGQKFIHVAGTNGKGSVSHMLAALFQFYGLNAGLYTSPHLKSFTERIRVNGQEIGEDYVADFVERISPAMEKIKPSFFELTVAMVFTFFRDQQTYISLIETGLGGRLDSTNVIQPILSVITSIGWDHMNLLGNTLHAIATEKAGILKEGVPAVIGEYRSNTIEAFRKHRGELYLADLHTLISPAGSGYRITHDILGEFQMSKATAYDAMNASTVLGCVQLLRKDYPDLEVHLEAALADYKGLTGLKGRWQIIGDSPTIITDTAHNKDGVRLIVGELLRQKYQKLHVVWGTVKDKDVLSVLSLLPKEANYYFCRPNIDRGLSSEELMNLAGRVGLKGADAQSVSEAIAMAKQEAAPDDLIYIGGSTFVVAEIENL